MPTVDERERDDRTDDTIEPSSAMMRSPRIWIIAGLLVIVAIITLAGWISRSTSLDEDVLTPTLLQLTQRTDVYQDKRVLVTGDVRVFEAGTPDEYYVLEEAGQFRVAIRGLPLTTLRPLTNARMVVEGVYHYEDGVGRYIDVTDWTTPSAPPAA